MVMYTLKFDNQALMATTLVLFKSDYTIQIYGAICIFYSHLLWMEENYDGKYGITVFVWFNG